MSISQRLDRFLQVWFPAEAVPATGETMMRRFLVRRGRGVHQLYIHHFIRATNDEAAHDHPWHFLSVMLRGGYTEKVYDHGEEISAKTYTAPCFLIRNRNTIHKLVEIQPDTWTLVLTSRWLGRWGYWSANGKWTYHKEEHKRREFWEKKVPSARPATGVFLRSLAEAELASRQGRPAFPQLVQDQSLTPCAPAKKP